MSDTAASIGKTLLWRYKAAISDCNLQKEAHRGLSDLIDPPILVEQWRRLCIVWDADGFPKLRTNPFKVDDTSAYQVR